MTMIPAEISHALVLMFFVLLALLVGGSLTLWMVWDLQNRVDSLKERIDSLKQEVDESKKAPESDNGTL